MTKEQVAVVIGPTASGKTALSIFLAKQLGGEVISGDSMQIYRHLSIGTAKVTPDEMDGVPHHLIDIKNVDEPFSAAEFKQLAREKITEIQSRGKLPIICGGTGLYIQSVLYDYDFSDEAVDHELRSRLEKQLLDNGPAALHRELAAVDPDSAAAIHPNNTRRVVRALEIWESTGTPPSKRQRLESPDELFHGAVVGLDMDRALLYDRINRRVDIMIENGLIDEAKWLMAQNVPDSQAAKAIGYKELFPYVRGEQSLDEAVGILKQNSRRYAKRQLTWFRNKMEIDWFDVSDESMRAEKYAQICFQVAGKLNLR